MKKFLTTIMICVLAVIAAFAFVACGKDSKSVEEVILNKTELLLEEGKSETLTATVLPEGASKSVSWSSSDESVATVAEGKVTAISIGNATVTATAGDKSATCKVIVKQSLISADSLVRDMNIKPTQTAAYEQYTNEALADYFAVANNHIVDNEIDTDNADVQAAAISAATKLFAYACYNERTLDQYTFFSSQLGTTDLGSTGSAIALRQEQYIRINEQEGVTDGYRYHSTLKKVVESEGSISKMKSLFESARIRITTETDILYRLEGKSPIIGGRNETLGVDVLDCAWEKGKDWGKENDIAMVKGEFIEPENIKDDIVNYANDDNHTIRANINILADNIVKNAMIIEDINGQNEREGYIVNMIIDTAVANQDEASLAMLRKANGSSNCQWVDDGNKSGLVISFRIWDNGLFRTYSVDETWKGKISGFSGSADSLTTYYYSYSDRDCNMAQYLDMLNNY